MRLVEQSSTHQWLGLKTSPLSSSIPALHCCVASFSSLYLSSGACGPMGHKYRHRDTSRRSGAALRVWLARVVPACCKGQALRRRRSSVGSLTGRRPLPFNAVAVPVRVPLGSVRLRRVFDPVKDLPDSTRAQHPLCPRLEKRADSGYLAGPFSYYRRPTVFRASAVLLNPGRHIQGELCWVRARRWQVCVGCGLDLIVCRL